MHINFLLDTLIKLIFLCLVMSFKYIVVYYIYLHNQKIHISNVLVEYASFV